MKINKEEWQEMNKEMELPEHRPRPPKAKFVPEMKPGLECPQITPLPDVLLGDEIYQPKINHPKHYNKGGIETIDVIEDWKLDFHCGSAVKYISRHKYKENPTQDIKKAIWYLERYLMILDS